MSMTNASGITIVRSLVAANTTPQMQKASWALAVIMAAINVMGDYAVTDRMMKMFKHLVRPGRRSKMSELPRWLIYGGNALGSLVHHRFGDAKPRTYGQKW